MAKRLYNVRAYEDTTENWAVNETVYPENSLLIDSNTGTIKKGNGKDPYSDLDFLGAKQVGKVEDISDWPESFPPAAHDHAVEEDATSGLEAAATIQDLAEALSARILALETALETAAGGEG